MIAGEKTRRCQSRVRDYSDQRCCRHSSTLFYKPGVPVSWCIGRPAEVPLRFRAGMPRARLCNVSAREGQVPGRLSRELLPDRA
jgi:hypothetical protein